MSKKVLDVGQCNPDHSSITRLLNANFEVNVQRAQSHAQAIEFATETDFDLILINRVLDADGSSGMDVLMSLKSNPQTQGMPVMLVSNYADAQEKAVASGAIRGFGKSSLRSPETLKILKKALG